MSDKRVWLGVGPSGSSTLSSSHPCIDGPCLVHWATVMIEQERDFPDIFPTKSKAENCLQCLDFLSLDLRRPRPPQAHSCSQAGNLHLTFAKPRLLQVPDRERALSSHRTQDHCVGVHCQHVLHCSTLHLAPSTLFLC